MLKTEIINIQAIMNRTNVAKKLQAHLSPRSPKEGTLPGTELLQRILDFKFGEKSI